MTTQQVGIELNEEAARTIDELPSAVTPAERRLALHYATSYWKGVGDVFENGPLLGGATRALALGMQYNKQRDPKSLLHTYDWFSSREELDITLESLRQALVNSKAPPEEVEAAQRAFDEEGTFLPAFEALHSHEGYWDLVRPHVGYLPGHRGEVPLEGTDAIFTAPDCEFGLAFIDGCKSWYGTKHWFREMASRWLPNTDLMFQDFSHYTCFWIPMLVGTFRECFELIAFVDYTYVWRMKEAPSEAQIEQAFPDEPTDLSRDDFDKIFKVLLQESVDRGDRRSVLVTQMQAAAAYAYIGLKDESIEVLDALLMQSEWLPYRAYLKQARVSPAYTPEGQVLL